MDNESQGRIVLYTEKMRDVQEPIPEVPCDQMMCFE